MHAVKFYDKFSVFLNVLLSVCRRSCNQAEVSCWKTVCSIHRWLQLWRVLTELFILNKSCLSAFTFFLPATTFFLPLQRSGRSTPVSWPSWRSWAVGSSVWCDSANGGLNTKWPSRPSGREPCMRRTSSRRPRSWCKEGEIEMKKEKRIKGGGK